MMMDLWTLLVENVFGGFWLAIVGLTIIFTIILALGTVSAFGIIIFCTFFWLAMAIGYGYPLITVFIGIIISAWAIYQWVSWMERGGIG